MLNTARNAEHGASQAREVGVKSKVVFIFETSVLTAVAFSQTVSSREAVV